MRAAEWLALAAVAGAVGALAIQLASGAGVWGSGLSGIDRFMCENLHSLVGLLALQFSTRMFVVKWMYPKC